MKLAQYKNRNSFPSAQLNRPSRTDVNGRCETDNHTETIGDVFARRKTKKTSAQKRRQKWKPVMVALVALANCFVELLGSICNCFPIGEVGNVRFQIDYLCGCLKNAKERMQHIARVHFSVILQTLVWVWGIFMFLLHLNNERMKRIPLSLRYWSNSTLKNAILHIQVTFWLLHSMFTTNFLCQICNCL